MHVSANLTGIMVPLSDPRDERFDSATHSTCIGHNRSRATSIEIVLLGIIPKHNLVAIFFFWRAVSSVEIGLENVFSLPSKSGLAS